MQITTRLVRSILALFIICSPLISYSSAQSQDLTGLEWLESDAYMEDQAFPVLLFLEQSILNDEVTRVSTISRMSRSARLKAVSKRLRSFVPTTAAAVENYLERNSATAVNRFWIVPAYTASLTPEQVRTLFTMSGVVRVIPDLEIEPYAPVVSRSAAATATSSSDHVRLMNVPNLWAMGLTGTGRLVCSFDTGVEQSHPALSANWRGNHADLSASWFSTVSPGSAPTDKADHGTHTMGIMVGVDGADTIGVAPGAEWITAGVIDQGKSLQGTFSDILAAFQWALNPDGNPATTDDVPDVILNSWGVPASLFGPCDNTFFAAIDNVEAAGIVCIFAAGNEGPEPSSLRNPGSRATSPLNAFSVGAVDNSKVIADFSSRGPGGCGFTAIKPEIVAPGVSVRSASKTGGYKLMSGTSMAAPFIAGLVALCRQYNPDATVEEIKWALINSSQDLGPAGEDNAYGYGLPDATRLLEHLSDPETPRFDLASFSISDNGVGSPGETFELSLTLTKTTGEADIVLGFLAADEADGVTVLAGEAQYNFGFSGTTSQGTQAYQVRFDADLLNGQEVDLELLVKGPDGTLFDSLQFTLPVGYAPLGISALHNSGSLEYAVSDYGQYGLAAGSIYNVGGEGFRYDGSENLLYEAGLMVGRSALQFAGSIRGADGEYDPSDFAPLRPLSDAWTGSDLAEHRAAGLVDDHALVSIPLEISQITSDYAQAGADGVIIHRYQLKNVALSTLGDLYFGFLTDFDLPGSSETIGYEESLNLTYQYGDSGPVVGVVSLTGLTSAKVVDNGLSKIGFSASEKFEMISRTSSITETTTTDLLSIVSGGPYYILPGDSVEVAFALIAAPSVSDLYLLAAEARSLFMSPTGIEYPTANLPGSYQLDQNYPNPFNPSTTISFSIPVAASVNLQVFNLLGQQVRELHDGFLPAGQHQMQWNSDSDGGSAVATGVYFYRLTVGDFSQSRKMILLR